MKLPVILEPLAEEDIKEVYRWYELQLTGLGSEFLVSIQSTFGRIERYPLIYQTIIAQLRRAPVERFPFGIFYVTKEEASYVLAVHHYSRNPDSLEKRLKLLKNA